MRATCFPRSIALVVLFCGCGSLASSPTPKPPYLVLNAPPAASVTSVAVSPDRRGAPRLVATSAFEGGVRIYGARTGEMLRVIDSDIALGGREVAFSPDGRSLTRAGFNMDKQVRVWDVRTGKLVKTLAGHNDLETYAVAFSTDGRLLASAGTDRQILVWELGSGTLRHRMANQPLPVTALAFSPDSATLASGGGEKTIRLWDTASGRMRQSLAGHSDWISTLEYSPDGKTLASGSCDWAYHRGRYTAHFGVPDPGCKSEWRLWDTETGELRRAVTEPARLLSLAFAPDGQALACGVGNDVRVYDLRAKSGAEVPGRTIKTHDAEVTSVAFSADGKAVVSGSHDRTVRCVALADGSEKWLLPGCWEQVNSVALSADRSLLVTGTSDVRFAERLLKASARRLAPGAVRFWDARTGRLLRRLGDPAEQVMAVAVSPDGRRVVSGGAVPDGTGVVRVWDAQTGAAGWSRKDHAAEVLAIGFAPDGSSLATAGADGIIKLRDPKTGAVVRALAGHTGGATSISFSRDGGILACGGGDGAARLWDVRTGRLTRTFQPEGSKAPTTTADRLITSVALGPDGEMLATGTASVGPTFGEPVRFWDTRSGAMQRQLANAEVLRGLPMALSPDGAILATGGKSVKLWDVKTGKPLRELRGHLKKTQSIAFSADGRILVAGGNYGTTNLWEVASGRHLVTLFAFPRDRFGKITDDWLAYHPEGYYDGSRGVDRYLSWRVGDELRTPQSPGAQLHRPDRVESALKLDQPARAF